MLIFVNYSELKKQHGKNNFDKTSIIFKLETRMKPKLSQLEWNQD